MAWSSVRRCVSARLGGGRQVMGVRRAWLGALPEFGLERYFYKYEFTAPYTLCSSDTESISLKEALEDYADDECRTLLNELSLGYTEVRGYPALLEELARWYAAETAAETARQVTERDFQEIAPQEGILLAMLALAPGAKVVTTWPGYQSLFDVASTLGADVRYWKPTEMPTETARGGLGFDVETLKPLLDQATVLVVNFPHNPTGFLPTPQAWTELIDECRKRGVWLFSDEMYRGLEYETAHRLEPAVAYERGISLSGLSKSLGMPGARIGWLACRDADFMAKVAGLRDWTTICSSAPSQVLATIAVRSRERLQSRARGFVQAGFDAVDAVLSDHSNLLRWDPPPVAGPCGFVRILNPHASAKQYCAALVEHSGILLLPSTVYGAGDSHFRVGLGRITSPEVALRWRDTLSDPSNPATKLLL